LQIEATRSFFFQFQVIVRLLCRMVYCRRFRI